VLIAEAAEEKEIETAGALWNNLGYSLEMVAEYDFAKAAYENAP
jgi:hypothetical protein